MKINIFKTLFILITCLIFNSPGLCTELPKPVVDFIKQKFPQAVIRFDGFVELQDKTAYLPILPLVYNSSSETAEIIQTIPAKTDFSEKPDMVLFNNNLALLKIIREEGQSPTVINSNEMPLKVKLGLLPQDLVVPNGLVLPPDLKVILGNLKIPLKQKTDPEGEVAFYDEVGEDEISVKNSELIGKTTEYVYKIPELKFFNEKKIYTANFKENKLNVLDSATGRLKKSIQLPSIAFDTELTPDARYILMTASAVDKVFVVDTVNDEFVKSIDVGRLPASVTCVKKSNKAYIANKLSSTISEVDLVHMKTERELPVTGYPVNISPSENEDFIFYYDSKKGIIYQLNLKTESKKELFSDNNVSKIGQFGRYLFSLSRSENSCTVYDLKEEKVIKKVKTGEKPLDFAVLEKMGQILILCAGSDELNVIGMDDFDLIKSIKLESGGFPGKINLVKKESRAVITNYDSYEVLIYNVDTEKVQGHIPVSHIVSTILIKD